MTPKSGTWREKKARRQAASAAQHVFGEPQRPRGLSRATRNAWNALCADLLAARKLAKDDGPRLLELIQARGEVYRGASERKAAARQRVAEIEAVFGKRIPFPEPTAEPAPDTAPPAISLEAFLAATAQQRATFAARLVPGQTVCLDTGGVPYEWPEGDASYQAREYCQRVTQGAIPACDLLKRACARHLYDLEHGAERGLFYDPLAARQIVEWFRDFCGMALADWQIFVAVSLHGWRLPSGLRRFTSCFAWVARQNGKSSLAAGIGLFGLLADGELRAQIYSAATTKEQAEIVFKDAKAFVAGNAELRAAMNKFRYSLYVEETDSCFQPLASEIASLDGLRPSVLVADEIHEWENAAGGREQWAKLTSGMVSRTQPLTIAISTAGGAQRGFGWEKYSLVKKILHGTITAEDIFCAVWELEEGDDHKDSALWIKANPSLGGHLKMSALQKQLEEAENDPSALSGFLRYTCNRWIAFTKQQTTFTLAKVDACRGYPDLPSEMQTGAGFRTIGPKELLEIFIRDNYGEPCFGGYDHGETDDLACFCLLFPRVKLPNGETVNKKVLIADFWMPEAMVAQREKEWQMPVRQWIREGWITVCEGDLNDPRVIKQDIMETLQQKHPVNGFIMWNVKSIGYDRWHSRPFMAVLSAETNTECLEVPQQPSTWTPICVALKEAVLFGNLWTLGNPVIRWMFQNVILEMEGKHGAITPSKPNKHAKIDVVQACCNAWQRMDAAPEPSVYLKRGIITL